MEPNADILLGVCSAQVEEVIKAVAAEQKPQSLKDTTALSHSECKELSGTITFTKSTLASATTKCTTTNDEKSYILCITAILRNLQALFKIITQQDINSKNKIITFNAKRIKIFQLDFSLRQKVDQLSAIYLGDKKGGSHIIIDPDGRNFWDKHFGSEVISSFVPHFRSTL